MTTAQSCLSPESYEEAMESAPTTKAPTDKEQEEMALRYILDGFLPDYDDLDIEDYYADRLADEW